VALFSHRLAPRRIVGVALMAIIAGACAAPVRDLPSAPSSAIASIAASFAPISFAPVPSATPLPPLAATFVSAIHGYSISYPAGWSVRPATKPWLTGFAAQSDQAIEDETDHFVATTRDTLRVTSLAIPAGQTFDAWLVDYRNSLIDAGVGPESPETWAKVNIGGQPGLWWGGSTEYDPPGGGAVVAVGGRAYVFRAQTLVNPFNNQPDTRGYLDPDQFVLMLATVHFDPASAIGAP
jgi:hypothetical protein